MRRIVLAAAALLLSLPLAARADDLHRDMRQEKDGLWCPKDDDKRTPQQVIADRLAAASRGDIDGLMCSYAADAVVVQPGFVAHGRAEIRQGFLQLVQLFGGQLPQVTSQTFGGNVALLTFSITGSFFSIPDGADTYVIERGKIVAHTVHASLQVNAPPPQP